MKEQEISLSDEPLSNAILLNNTISKNETFENNTRFCLGNETFESTEVICNPSVGILVSVPICAFENSGLSAQKAYLNDIDCEPKLTEDFIIFNLDFRDTCGTIIRKSDTFTIFSNSINFGPTNQSESQAIRESTGRVEFSCSLKTDHMTAIQLNIDPGNRTEIDQALANYRKNL